MLLGIGPDLGLASTGTFVVRHNKPFACAKRSPRLAVHLDDPLVEVSCPSEIFLRDQKLDDGPRAHNPTG